MRQAVRTQVIPQVDNMDHYLIDYDNDKIHFAKEILRMWRNKRAVVKDTIAPDRYQAGCDTFYLEWLHANLEGSVTKGINMGGRIKDKAAEAEIKYRWLKRKVPEFEAKHREQHEKDNKEIEMLRQ